LGRVRQHRFSRELARRIAEILPVRTVGMMAPAGPTTGPRALHAVTSTDDMTADYYPFSHAILGRVANRIINEVRGIIRVTYNITSMPSATIEWE
jgi:GMP synthase (glutamine-hydrolysing)